MKAGPDCCSFTARRHRRKPPDELRVASCQLRASELATRNSQPHTIRGHEADCVRDPSFRRNRSRQRTTQALQRRRGIDPGDAGGAEGRPHHLARSRPAVPHAHRHVRGQDQRRDHRQSESAGRSGRARPRAQGGQDPRPAARHPHRAQGQHPDHEHADHRRRAGLRWPGAAVRGHADQKPPRRRRHHHRQDADDGAGQLGRRQSRHAQQLQRAQRLRPQSLRPAARSARGHLRRPPRAQHRRLELRHRHRRELLGGERGHRDVRLHPQPREREHARRGEAHRRPRQPLRRHPHHRRPGHARPDGQVRRRRRHPPRRAGRKVARPERPGHHALHAAAEQRLHRLPEKGRAQRRAHRHPARELLRQDQAAGRGARSRRTQ